MKCALREHGNRPWAKFCEECAAPLPRVCPNCGAPLSATAKFCSKCAHPTDRRAPPASASWRFVAPDIYTSKHLAEKILTSKDAFEGERKQVTVLFSRRDAFIERRAGREWELRARQPEVAAALERARETGDADNAALLIGQDAGLIHDIPPPVRSWNAAWPRRKRC